MGDFAAAERSGSAQTARQMWALFEPVHMVTYFHPAGTAAFVQAGLRGFWRGYFAGRAAPVGPVGAPPVIAAFFGFAPPMVARALPAVWDLITPAEALNVRLAGAVAALRQLLGLPDGAPAPAEIGVTADRLTAVIEGLDGAGRPLGGPNAALPVPGEPVARLWHAATVLREHRGDGHVAALVAAGLDGCEALVLRTAVERAAASQASSPAGPGSAPEPRAAAERSAAAATGPASETRPAAAARPAAWWTGLSWPREQIQPLRGWTDDAWDQAAARLAGRGWIDTDGVATAEGAAAHRDIELATDLAASRPWARLDPAEADALAAALTPITRAAAGALPFPNPVGVAPPAAAAAGRP